MNLGNNPSQIITRLLEALPKSGALHSIHQRLIDSSADPISEIKSVELTSNELASLSLPRQYVFAKMVQLPANFLPVLEAHDHSSQATLVVEGTVTWAQQTRAGAEEISTIQLERGRSVYTPAGVLHGHATSEASVVLLAVFTDRNPIKDRIQPYTWN